MVLQLGVKSDPIENRYTFEWLFDLMNQAGVYHLQLGTFFELYGLDDAYFLELRELAESYEVSIESMLTAHRELGGFLSGNRYLERTARASYERMIAVGGIVGARYVGSSPGSVPRDKLQLKDGGIRTYLRHMKELMELAKESGIRALTIEPMSSIAEPPSFPVEISQMMEELAGFHRAHHETTVPVYLCVDMSHGVADQDRRVLHSNTELFEYCIPWMCEFHIKNTDASYESTFGFSGDDSKKGIVKLDEIARIFQVHADDLPVDEIVGYLEIPGPKLGRDFSDCMLADQLHGSIEHVKEELRPGSVFPLMSGGRPKGVKP